MIDVFSWTMTNGNSNCADGKFRAVFDFEYYS